MKFKKNLKKVVLAVLAASFVAGSFSGCKSNDEQSSSGKTEKLKWVMLGMGNQKDQDEVHAEFNKKLQEYLPGTEVEFEIITAADYEEKWNLMMATNEQVDIAWSGYAVKFDTQMQQESYMQLDDLLEKYGQDMKKELPEWVFDLTSVDGNVYAIPNYQMMSTWPRGVFVAKKYSDKYFDRNAIMAKFDEWAKDNTEEKGREFYGLWEQGLEKMKQDGELGNGIATTFSLFNNDLHSDKFNVKGFSIDSRTKKIVVDAKMDYVKLWYDIAADWYKKGYIRNDILSAQDQIQDPYKNQYRLYVHNYSDKSAEIETKAKGEEMDCIPLSKTYFVMNNVPATMTVIPRTAKYPEKAMQLINLMNSAKGKDLYNLLVWGIEGKHYNKVTDKRIETLYKTPQATADDDYGLPNWAVGNIKNSYEHVAHPEGYADFQFSLDAQADVSEFLGFRPDTKQLTTELAQVNAVMTEYEKTLLTGASDDYKKTYDEYISKLDTAGVEKIREELQRQLDEWVKENK